MTTMTTCSTCHTRFNASDGQMCPRCLLLGARPGGPRTDESLPDGTRPWEAASGRATPVMKPAQVDELFPELEVLDVIGHGGMGVVYRARQKNLGREVALKLLSSELMDDPAFAERFTREARAMAMMNHPNIIAIYDFGKRENFYFLVMEYVDGLNLRQLIHGTRIEPAEAMQMVPQLCDALQYAHDRGIVHRDIKPENVLVSQEGHVKIADFGLAKLTDPAGENLTLTRTRQVMGTLNYMAPEQMERPTDVDHRADIYSLGVVIYELLTGELPLGRFSPPSQKAEVDSRLDDIVLRALEKDPSLRYQQASEFKTGIQGMDMPVSGWRPREADRDQQLAWKIARFVWLSVAISFCVAGGMMITIATLVELEDVLWVPGFSVIGIGALMLILTVVFQAVFNTSSTVPDRSSRIARHDGQAKAGLQERLPNYLIGIKCLAMVFFFACPVLFIAYGMLDIEILKFAGVVSPIVGGFIMAIFSTIAHSKGYRETSGDQPAGKNRRG
jgi:predicted Ser/Thr protein kinase